MAGREATGKIADNETSATDSTLVLLGPSQNEDYYPTISIHTLIKILKDPSLSVHHTAVVQALMYIFKTLGLKCVPFLQSVRFALNTLI
jgi:FKBP12-rapamycin complex-associated protein